MEFLMGEWMGQPVWMWAVFLVIVLVLMALDMGVLHKKPKGGTSTHIISVQESLWMTLGYMVLATAFGGWVWYELGQVAAVQYYTGYVVELSLSMDNVFVIAMILGFFKIPRAYQHRVLFWGILGVLFLRGIMIGLGATIVEEFDWVLFGFAGFLVFTGFKMLLSKEEDETDLEKNPILLFLRKYTRVTDKFHGQKFFVRLKDSNTKKMATYMTPLMVALILVELADVLFAVDSVPAIFAITTSAYIVFTSNVFAILGLRALYFALSAMMERFAYVKFALAILLMFIGGKMILDKLGLLHIPELPSLAITLVILTSGVVFSFVKTKHITNKIKE